MSDARLRERLDETLHEWWNDDHGDGSVHHCRPVPSEDEFLAAAARHGIVVALTDAERVCASPGCGLPSRLHGAPPNQPPNPTRSSHVFRAAPGLPHSIEVGSVSGSPKLPHAYNVEAAEE